MEKENHKVYCELCNNEDEASICKWCYHNHLKEGIQATKQAFQRLIDKQIKLLQDIRKTQLNSNVNMFIYDIDIRINELEKLKEISIKKPKYSCETCRKNNTCDKTKLRTFDIEGCGDWREKVLK